MIGIIFELVDFFILLKGVSPFKKYKNESIEVYIVPDEKGTIYTSYSTTANLFTSLGKR